MSKESRLWERNCELFQKSLCHVGQVSESLSDSCLCQRRNGHTCFAISAVMMTILLTEKQEPQQDTWSKKGGNLTVAF